jgi:hypothetical protein
MVGANVMVVAAFAVAATFVVHQPGNRRPGLLLFTAGLQWPLNSAVGWNVGPPPFIHSLTELASDVEKIRNISTHAHPCGSQPKPGSTDGSGLRGLEIGKVPSELG